MYNTVPGTIWMEAEEMPVSQSEHNHSDSSCEYDPDCSACKAEAIVNRQSYELAQLEKQNFVMKNALETISVTCRDGISRSLAERILKIIGKPL